MTSVDSKVLKELERDQERAKVTSESIRKKVLTILNGKATYDDNGRSSLR